MKEIKPEELQKNPFQMIGKEWLLVTAEKEGKINIENFKTKAQYSPFDGQEYAGEAVMTIINGKIVANKL